MMTSRTGRVWCSGWLAILLLTLGAEAARSEEAPSKVIAVVVHPKNPVQTLSANELRDIFLKRRQVWPGGQTIIPINPPLESAVKLAFERSVLGMTPQQVGAYWVKAAVTGKTTAPRRVGTTSLAKQLVAALPGAVAYIELSLVDASVKAIAVEGILPTSPKYKHRY